MEDGADEAALIVAPEGVDGSALGCPPDNEPSSSAGEESDDEEDAAAAATANAGVRGNAQPLGALVAAPCSEAATALQREADARVRHGLRDRDGQGVGRLLPEEGVGQRRRG